MSTKRKLTHDNVSDKDVVSNSTIKRNKNDNQSSCMSEKDNLDSKNSQFLKNVKAFILPAGIAKVRIELFKKQLLNYGGHNISSYDESEVTHIIVDEKMDIDRMCRILKINQPAGALHVVKSLWLSSCLKEKQHVSESPFELEIKHVIKKSETPMLEASSTSAESPNIKTNDNSVKIDSKEISEFTKVGVMWQGKKSAPMNDDPDSDYLPSGDEDIQPEDVAAVNAKGKEIPKGHWVCAHSSKNSLQNINHNQHITDKLQELAKVYENANDKWRALGYTKAIMALKKYPKPVTTFQEAKAIPGVGEKLAEKIWEIIESGELRKLNELTAQEDVQILNLFTGVWGAGAHTARAWLQQGFRSLDDLHTKANLTRQQKVGLRLYDDLLDRMPREEATEIEAVVKRAAMELDPGLVCMACGSYRRGKATCGDVDVLVTHPDGRSHRGVFAPLLNKLRNSGFITDDLVMQEDSGNQKKYLGVCKLPGEDRKHRRLDIIVVPYDEFACALMYFTGSAHFNRSMRHMAGKMGMSLSEHSLNKGVVRQHGQKINEGFPLPTPTEESVFQHLGLKYRPPEERDH